MVDSSFKNDGYSFREAADRVWEMALEYEREGLIELAGELKSIVSQIHALARAHQVKNKPVDK